MRGKLMVGCDTGIVDDGEPPEFPSLIYHQDVTEDVREAECERLMIEIPV